ncbi:hypothetical protein Angca_002959, partial [Angiostrongylus cantonensis]
FSADRTKRVFKKSANAWSEDTCINFEESETAPDRAVVYNSLGCATYVGRIGGKQSVYLGQMCD